jgi:hypothetical protein
VKNREINVPNGYKLVKDGAKIEFVLKYEDWQDKHFSSLNNIKARGYFAMITQQLSDFNKGWKPDWFDGTKLQYCILRKDGIKPYDPFHSSNRYPRILKGGCGLFQVVTFRYPPFVIDAFNSWYPFLAFKTWEDADDFLFKYKEEIKLADKFIQ